MLNLLRSFAVFILLYFYVFLWKGRYFFKAVIFFSVDLGTLPTSVFDLTNLLRFPKIKQSQTQTTLRIPRQVSFQPETRMASILSYFKH